MLKIYLRFNVLLAALAYSVSIFYKDDFGRMSCLLLIGLTLASQY